MTTNDTETEGPVHVVLEVGDHDSLRQMLHLINESDLPVRTESIAEASLSTNVSTSIDLDILTTKQLDTLELALEGGYYERPRETDLTDLAEELDISRSAVSQRLRTAELKLIKVALERYR